VLWPQALDLAPHKPLNDPVELEIQGGADNTGARAPGQVGPGLQQLHEMRRLEGTSRRVESESFSLRAGELGGGDEANLAHPFKHPELALACPVRMAQGIEARGRLGQAGEQGAFRDAEVPQGFAEVKVRGGRAPGVQIAVVHAVQVLRDNALFVPRLLEPQGLESFDELGAKGARTGLCELDQLLGQCRAAAEYPAMPDQAPGRPQRCLPIHAGMAPKAFVLSRQGGPDQGGRNLCQARRLKERRARRSHRS